MTGKDVLREERLPCLSFDFALCFGILGIIRARRESERERERERWEEEERKRKSVCACECGRGRYVSEGLVESF